MLIKRTKVIAGINTRSVDMEVRLMKVLNAALLCLVGYGLSNDAFSGLLPLCFCVHTRTPHARLVQKTGVDGDS